MKYPVNIKLRKLETRKDAEYPQEDKYASGSIISQGLMWKHTLPEVGKDFLVMYSKLDYNFHTSKVEEILEKDNDKIVIKTKNSVYEIIING